MRSLLTLVGAAVVTFAVVGWFLGWYKVNTTPGPDGHRAVNIDFNGPKIQQDIKNGEARILSAAQRTAEGTNAPAAPPSLPLPTPGANASPGPTPTPPGPLELPLPPGAAVAAPAGTVVVRPVPTGTTVPNSTGLSLPYPPQ